MFQEVAAAAERKEKNRGPLGNAEKRPIKKRVSSAEASFPAYSGKGGDWTETGKGRGRGNQLEQREG